MSLASEINELRDGLKSRLPTYGFFDGVAAALILGFLGVIAPTPAPKKPRGSTTKHHGATRRGSAISSRITHG
jgi:hypothetical protein